MHGERTVAVDRAAAAEREQDQRPEGGAEAGPGEQHEPEDQAHLAQRDQDAEQTPTIGDGPAAETQAAAVVGTRPNAPSTTS